MQCHHEPPQDGLKPQDLPTDLRIPQHNNPGPNKQALNLASWLQLLIFTFYLTNILYLRTKGKVNHRYPTVTSPCPVQTSKKTENGDKCVMIELVNMKTKAP